MKLNITNTLIRTVLPLLILGGWCPAIFAQSAPTAVKPVAGRSVFVIPNSPKEGCDPFFPDSTRPYESSNVPAKQTFEVSSLVFRGISGPVGHQFAIINNHTFAQGDEGDVLTSQGRVHLECIEIKANSVVIEYGGQRHELKFDAK